MIRFLFLLGNVLTVLCTIMDPWQAGSHASFLNFASHLTLGGMSVSQYGLHQMRNIIEP